MRKLDLCVATDAGQDFPVVWTRLPAGAETPSFASVRTSPLFSLDSNSEADIPDLSNGRSHVAFLFVSSGFLAAGRLVRHPLAVDYVPRTFLSRGLASLVFFGESAGEVATLTNLLEKELFATEVWLVENGLIMSTSVDAPDLQVGGEFRYSIADLGLEYRVIFGELFPLLATAETLARTYIPHYLELFQSLLATTNELVVQLRFLGGNIDEAEAAAALVANCAHTEASALEVVHLMEGARSSGTDRLVWMHQLKDEAMTVSAVLQYVTGQAFGGLCPLITPPIASGDGSLLGIGGAFASLYSIYSHVRRTFASIAPERAIRDLLSKKRGLSFPRLSDLDKWNRDLRAMPDLDEVALEDSVDPSQLGEAAESMAETELAAVFHLVYYSRRLGFRATRHSVSAAHQAIALASLPPWTLCTLSHEYAHVHASVVLALIHPLAQTGGGYDSAYNRFESARDGRSSDLSVLEVLNALVCQTATLLAQLDREGGPHDSCERTFTLLDPPRLAAELRRYHHEIDETLAHVLDYRYFYASLPDPYVDSIWSTWLVLPIAQPRIREYLVRSLVTLATKEPGPYAERFDLALALLKDGLGRIRKRGYVDSDHVDLVSTVLANESEVDALRLRFWALSPLAEAAAHFLVSGRLRTALLFDEQAEKLADDTYRYTLDIGSYWPDPISSPTMFLSDYLRRDQAAALPEGDLTHVEWSSLWLLLVLSSPLAARNG